MEDWTAMSWHLKGYGLVVNSLYLRCDHPSKEGANATRSAEEARFAKALSTPWSIAGNFNVSPNKFAAEGSCGYLGDACTYTTPENGWTSFTFQPDEDLPDIHLKEWGATHIGKPVTGANETCDIGHQAEKINEACNRGQDTEELPEPEDPEQRPVTEASRCGGTTRARTNMDNPEVDLIEEGPEEWDIAHSVEEVAVNTKQTKEIDAITMHRLWDKYYEMRQDSDKAAAPEHISLSAAFQATERQANSLGRQYHP
eukprot:6648475-Pyramimonas_sp.AAC.1